MRKEAKGHGVGGRIAGPLDPGDRVLVVEDTVDDGRRRPRPRSTRSVEFGCEIVAASLLLDRGGQLGAALEPRGVAVPAGARRARPRVRVRLVTAARAAAAPSSSA